MTTCNQLTFTHQRGQVVRAAVTFTSDGEAVDPTTVRFRVKDPGGNVEVYTYGVDAEVVQDEAGAYHVDVNASLAGTWYVRVEGTGDWQAAAEGSFKVDGGEFD